MRDVEVNMEPLPGYRLIERIGAGGYGEVWRAEAPGGLTKAIKFVFGQQHEKRATNELRALEHVRSVRHPFLLSLERIEVVDDRLLVVTELADNSVKDRFDQCRRENIRGIPRDELISYLRDTADALDFMSNTHALQHLDIKPENLLLLAGRVKVADFGLVKDVRHSQASLVGGLTPLYAAPEVFRGAPSRYSDQYSLAIVYQEMLTGALPFAGESAAQLTLHHLNDEPDLSSLSPTDRYSVSRALAKDPQHRYNSCREFVDSLVNSKMSPAGGGTAPTSFSAANDSGSTEYGVRESKPTDFLDDEQPTDWAGGTSQVMIAMPASDCRLVDLPPLDVASQDARPYPTLVLGIGGTAGRVLGHFRRLMRDEVGKPETLPALQFLLIDTDSRALSELAREGFEFGPDEFLCLPLRRPQHYRDNAQQLLHWLSRRWLYNIPRSLRTEGLRPLGRLALADNARQAGQRIRRAMVQAVDPAAVAKSATVIGREYCNDGLRVIVVASISGATGGGMSLDIGYAVRAILQKLGLKHSQILGLMLHSTGRDARQSELARVNAFSWLSEYHHFEQPENAYPGDVSCGLPGHPTGVSAFDHTYIVHLGSNMDVAEYDQAAQSVADYIRLNTVSPASTFFDASRKAAEERRDDGTVKRPTLRAFGIHRELAPAAGNRDEFATEVCARLLAHWKGVDAAPTTTDEEEMQVVKRLQLDVGGIATNCRAFVELTLGGDAATFVAQCLPSFLVNSNGHATKTLRLIDQFFGRDLTQPDAKTTLAGKEPAELVRPLAAKVVVDFRRAILRKLDTPTARIGGARNSLDWQHEHLQRVSSELERIRRAASDRLLQIRDEAAVLVTSPKAKNTELGARLAEEFFHTSLDHVTVVAAEHVVRSVEVQAKAIGDEITSLSREIDQIAGGAGWASEEQSGEIGGGSTRSAANGETERSRHRDISNIAAQVDVRLQADCLDANGGLLQTVMQGGRPRAQLISKLRELSLAAVQNTSGTPDSHCIGSGTAERGGHSTAVALATPTLLEYGGRRRVLMIVPSSHDFAAVDATNQPGLSTATTITAREPGVTVCVEADSLSLPHVALDFVERRRDRVDFAARVHSRSDIEWSPIVAEEAPPAATFWGDESQRKHTQQAAVSKTLVM